MTAINEPAEREAFVVALKKAYAQGAADFGRFPDMVQPLADELISRARIAAEREAALVEALEQILAISSDRERFVMQGPRGFAQAEQIARAALTPEKPV